jgi:FkbM family methyltransferase
MKQLDHIFALPLVAETLRVSPLVYVDVGAAVGVEDPWSSMLRAVDLTRVVGFEPNPDNIKNIRRLPNGSYHQMAIGSTAGRASFYVDSTKSSLFDRSDEAGFQLPSIDVEVERLDNLRDRGVIPSLDVVKTDTELADFQSISSCGRYLDEEVLAVQCEFSFAPEPPEHPFRDFDALLQPKGFRLYGMSVKQGGLGEIGGGNLFYMRSVFDLLSRGSEDDKRRRGLKLLVVALTTSNMQAAYIIARALGDAGVLSPSEAASLREAALHYVYLPDTQPFSPRRVRWASLLGNLTVLAAGGFHRGTGAPKANRVEHLRRLVSRPGPLARRDVAEKLYERYYQDEVRRAGASRS